MNRWMDQVRVPRMSRASVVDALLQEVCCQFAGVLLQWIRSSGLEMSFGVLVLHGCCVCERSVRDFGFLEVCTKARHQREIFPNEMEVRSMVGLCPLRKDVIL